MQWLQSVDVELFRLINEGLSNPVLDALMPFFSGSRLSFALLYGLLGLGVFLLVWKGGVRGVVFVLMLLVVLAIGDGFICNTIKHAVERPRPFRALPDVHCLVGTGNSGSMPSSHAANWFAATMVALIYYRRSVWFMLPTALLVGLSRIYNGVHYPSDVVAGAILGAGYAGALVWSLDAAWRWVGQKWFPLWWQALPSLWNPLPRALPTDDEELSSSPDSEERAGEPGLVTPQRPVLVSAAGAARPLSGTGHSALRIPHSPPLPRVKGRPEPGFRPPHVTLDQHWLRFGYIIIALLLVARWAYLASGTIQLCEDEAYQWLWSKHLAFSYYSKPPLIAYTQFLGTALWGDTAFGVRFFSPIIAALLSLVVLRFFAREVNARAGFFLLLLTTATPLFALGALLMTVDPLNVLFWTAAMVAGWRAVQESSRTRDWLWVGLWMGLGFLSRYTALFQWLCWAVFFALWPPARKQLRRPGPYLALLLNLLCAAPVLIWNWQHGWVTIGHVAADASVGSGWQHPVKYPLEFLGSELGLLNPVFFVAMVWAAIAFWRRGRHNPRLLFFFSMGAPVFLVYLLHSFHSRVLPNWIAPAVLPLFCLMVIYWDMRWRLGVSRLIKGWLTAGLVLGFAVVLLGHNTDLVTKLTGYRLPVNKDPLHRVRVWSDVAKLAGQAREELLAEGKPVFIITEHYGLAGLISFYLPEAREQVSDTPLVYFRTSTRPENQFYFWPGYTGRKGENAICVLELDRDDPTPRPPPAHLAAEFDSVADLGVRNVLYHGRLCRPIQVFACRGLR